MIEIHPNFKDGDLELDPSKNKQIKSDAMTETIYTYMRGELDDNSINEDYKYNGVNYMKPLTSVMG